MLNLIENEKGFDFEEDCESCEENEINNEDGKENIEFDYDNEKTEDDTYLYYAKNLNNVARIEEEYQNSLFERNENLNLELNKLIINKLYENKNVLLLVDFLEKFKREKRTHIVTFYDSADSEDKDEKFLLTRIEWFKKEIISNKKSLKKLLELISIVKLDYNFLTEFYYSNLSLFNIEEQKFFISSLKEINRNKDKILKGNLKLVIKIAKKYKNEHLLFIDLIQEGNIGLIKGIDKFKYKLKNKLSTYVSWWINQSIKDALTKKSRAIKIPSNIVNVLFKIKKMENEERISRDKYSAKELSFKLNIPLDKIEKALNAPEDISSIDIAISNNSGDKDVFISDLIESENDQEPDKQFFVFERKKEILNLISVLTEREKNILSRRFGLYDGREQTLEEVGVSIGLTRERVRQITEEALVKLRKDDTVNEKLRFLM